MPPPTCHCGVTKKGKRIWMIISREHMALCFPKLFPRRSFCGEIYFGNASSSAFSVLLYKRNTHAIGYGDKCKDLILHVNCCLNKRLHAKPQRRRKEQSRKIVEKKINSTRMDSSRMRTVRAAVTVSGCLPRRCLPGAHPWGLYTFLVNRMTDRCKNITFPQLRLRTVKTSLD